MLDLVKGDDVLAVIQVGVDRIRNNDQFLILAIEKFESIPAQVAGVSLLAVGHEHSTVDLTCVGEQSCVHERGLGIYCPAVVGIERTGMVAALSLVVVVIVFDR